MIQHNNYDILKSQPKLLRGILRGLEKESLRVDRAGALAQTPHPQALGAALCHPRITTDYSEALLEFITEPHSCINTLLQQLDDIHRYTYSHIGSETLWTSSMPCELTRDADVPVARYGFSNVGRMKSVYRLGLGNRYGRSMQTIAGIHYNFSLPDGLWQALHEAEQSTLSLQDFKTERYFAVIRNFRRYYWLLIYLFGAAPAVCRSFVKGREHQLETFDDNENTLYKPYATSLRMGDLGYQSSAQKELTVGYNKLDNYLQTLCGAITRSHTDYHEIGVKGEPDASEQDESYRQLNSNLLQIENEFYSAIRPKRTAKPGETALGALQRGGVEYIEIRCIDLNPFEPMGITAEQMRFVDSFLVYCLLADSPDSDSAENLCISENQHRIVYRGREPGLKLQTAAGERDMKALAAELINGIEGSAKLLDRAFDSELNSEQHQQSLDVQRAKLDNPELTPSAQLLQAMRDGNKTFLGLSLEQAQKHRASFNGNSLKPCTENQYAAMAAQSMGDQTAIEKADSVDFETYLSDYYQQYQNCGRG